MRTLRRTCPVMTAETMPSRASYSRLVSKPSCNCTPLQPTQHSGIIVRTHKELIIIPIPCRAFAWKKMRQPCAQFLSNEISSKKAPVQTKRTRRHKRNAVVPIEQ